MRRYSSAERPVRGQPAGHTLQSRALRREVTPLVFPVDLETEAGVSPPPEGDSSIDSLGPTTPVDPASLDMVWADVRRAKERMLAASPPKVQSFEVGVIVQDNTTAIDHLPQRPKIKRRRSIVELGESPDGRFVTAVFDVVGVKKDDMHVSYQGNRLIVTWRVIRTTEKMEDGVLVRERFERNFHRTIPLPIGTKFNEIRAAKETGQLSITYPNSRVVRVE